MTFSFKIGRYRGRRRNRGIYAATILYPRADRSMISPTTFAAGGDNGTELALVRAGDVVPLHAIRQAGASGVVTALHQIPYGVVWSIAEIEAARR